MVVKRLHHAIKMRCRSEQDKHVEDLMGAAPDIECSWKTPLRPSSLYSQSVSYPPPLWETNGMADHVESCAEDIHGTVNDDPRNADSVFEPLVAIDGDAVNNRDEAG